MGNNLSKKIIKSENNERILQPTHEWYINNIPFFKHLEKEKIIKVDNKFNCVYPFWSIDDQKEKFILHGKELLFNNNIPSSAIKFALRPVSYTENGPVQEPLWEPSEYQDVQIAQHGCVQRIWNKSIATQGLIASKVKMKEQEQKGVFVTPSFWVCNRVYGSSLRHSGNIYKLNFQCRVRQVLEQYPNTVDDYVKEANLIHNKIEWICDPKDVQVYGIIIKAYPVNDVNCTLAPEKRLKNWYKKKDNEWKSRSKEIDSYDYDQDGNGYRMVIGSSLPKACDLNIQDHIPNKSNIEKVSPIVLTRFNECIKK